MLLEVGICAQALPLLSFFGVVIQLVISKLLSMMKTIE